MQRLCFLYFEFNRFSIKNSRSSVLGTPAIFVFRYDVLYLHSSLFNYIVLYFASYRVLQRFGLLFFRMFSGILACHCFECFAVFWFIIFLCFVAFWLFISLFASIVFFRNKRNPVTHCVFLNDRKIIFV